MSARHEFLTRAKAFEARAVARTIRFVVRTSINLSRALLLGLVALVFLPAVPEHIDVAVLPLHVGTVQTQPVPASGTSDVKVETTPAADNHDHIRPDAPSSPTPSSPVSDTKTGDSKAGVSKTEESKTEDSKTGPVKPAPAPLPPAKQPAPPWTEEQITAAKAECSRLLDKIPVVTEPLPPARQGICGAPAPRELRSVGENKVKLHPPATLRCPMIAALNTWVSDNLQPSAKKHFGSPIARIVGGSYSCRNRYGLARAPISEHALMNAIDISAFVLENGKVIRVSSGWKAPPKTEGHDSAKSDSGHGDGNKGHKVVASKLGAHDLAPHDDDNKAKTKAKTEDPKKDAKEDPKVAASEFLHQAHDDACAIFGTVLGPDTNAAHHNHLHLDMKARKYRSICE